MTPAKEMRILIAEDDDGHAELIREALVASGVCNPIQRFRDGEEAWAFLSEKGLHNDFSYLLLLDINMPRLDGVEVLRRIKADQRLREIPVMMLTTTDDPREIEQCYSLGCNAYITKPVQFPQFTETLKRLGLFIQIVSIA